MIFHIHFNIDKYFRINYFKYSDSYIQCTQHLLDTFNQRKYHLYKKINWNQYPCNIIKIYGYIKIDFYFLYWKFSRLFGINPNCFLKFIILNYDRLILVDFYVVFLIYVPFRNITLGNYINAYIRTYILHSLISAFALEIGRPDILFIFYTIN